MHPAQAPHRRGHLPDKEKAWVDAKLVKAFNHADPEQGLRNAKHLAGLLYQAQPGAANYLREGLEQMFTVSRPGIDGRRVKTLVMSNPVESMISIARTTNRNVTRWRTGHMVLRWAAGCPTLNDPSATSRLQADAPAHRRAAPARSPPDSHSRRNRRSRRLELTHDRHRRSTRLGTLRPVKANR